MVLFRILHYDTLDSTNNKAKELAKLGAEEGTVVFADYQTKGRGQFRRRWLSPKGKNLLFSIILRPVHMKVNSISMMTQVAAMSMRDTLQKELNLKSKIKRPNDLLVQGKKVCGILVESSSYSNSVEYLIVGVGLNVNSKANELVRRATSIYEEVGVKQDRNKLLGSFLRCFKDDYLQVSGKSK